MARRHTKPTCRRAAPRRLLRLERVSPRERVPCHVAPTWERRRRAHPQNWPLRDATSLQPRSPHRARRSRPHAHQLLARAFQRASQPRRRQVLGAGRHVVRRARFPVYRAKSRSTRFSPTQPKGAAHRRPARSAPNGRGLSVRPGRSKVLRCRTLPQERGTDLSDPLKTTRRDRRSSSTARLTVAYERHCNIMHYERREHPNILPSPQERTNEK